jgi:hypothetical protein
MNLSYTGSLANGTVPVEDHMDVKVLQMWSIKEIAASSFYRTGFETIMFNRDRNFSLQCLLSSAFSWDSKLLIAGSTKNNIDVQDLVYDYNINHLSYSVDSGSESELEALLAFKHTFTHLLINVDESFLKGEWIGTFIRLAEKYKLMLIVNCLIDTIGLNDKFQGCIDFLVGEYHDDFTKSFVVARRSKLVQIEGNSRSFTFDLYAFWQWSMRNRNPIIEPMCV